MKELLLKEQILVVLMTTNAVDLLLIAISKRNGFIRILQRTVIKSKKVCKMQL